MTTLRKRSHKALHDQKLQRNLGKILPQVVVSRHKGVSAVENWEELRTYGHQVKAHTMSRLHHYLQEFEGNVIAHGGKVFWADTATEANEFILELAHKRGVRKVVKSKSMLGEEIFLNQALEKAHIETVETDLGEYIVQMAGDRPSHLVAPALHMSKEEIAQLFTDNLGMPPTDDAAEITAKARQILRQEFLTAQMGITGVNFGVAETGTVVVVENEGNARLSIALPRIHVAIMGIEKVLPRMADLPVFLKLLTRSATGQKITSYINFIHGARYPGELDGPAEFYLVLVDNGRTQMLEDELLRQTLYCIRCGACLTACPVYDNVGGHCYGSTYPGPIGAILTPQLDGLPEGNEHPFVSSLCGACHDTCPVKIEIPHILLKLRQLVQEAKNSKASRLPFEKLSFKLWSKVMVSPKAYCRSANWLRKLAVLWPGGMPTRLQIPPLNRWSDKRDLPQLARKSFREIYQTKEDLT